jgi:oligopeptidase B
METRTLNQTAPRAQKRQYSYTQHGVTISDPYHWLRDPAYPDVTDPDVLAHLRAENQWFEAAMAPHKGLIDTLFAEMRGRIKEDDATVPQRDGDWLY